MACLDLGPTYSKNLKIHEVNTLVPSISDKRIFNLKYREKYGNMALMYNPGSDTIVEESKKVTNMLIIITCFYVYQQHCNTTTSNYLCCSLVCLYLHDIKHLFYMFHIIESFPVSNGYLKCTLDAPTISIPNSLFPPEENL